MLGLRGAARVKTILFTMIITAVGAFKIELLACFFTASNVDIFMVNMI